MPKKPREMSEWERKLLEETEKIATPTFDPQALYLRRKATEERELDKCCDCTGNCDEPKCFGFKRDCKCQFSIEELRKARGLVTKHEEIAESISEDDIPF